VLTDVDGNRYEIELAEMDEASAGLIRRLV